MLPWTKHQASAAFISSPVFVCRSYNARQLHASATSEDVTATALPALKAELVKMAGSKNGVDLSEEDSKAVMNQLKKFEGLGRDDPERMDLAGSKWRVLFTDTDGAYEIATLTHQN